MQIGDALNAGDDFKLRFHASVAAQDRAIEAGRHARRSLQTLKNLPPVAGTSRIALLGPHRTIAAQYRQFTVC
jgi:hypothetical protein